MHAVTEWQVDIITLSFEPGCTELGDAIRSAYRWKVLVFAAASNVGAHAAMPAFPARMSNVYCIYSGDGMGNYTRTSPTARSNHYNFLTLGEAVESAWPVALSDNPWKKRKSGTSFATPIAVGIAAFLLLYAYQTLPEECAKKLKEYDKMRDFLFYYLSHERGGYHVLSMNGFFKRPEEERRRMPESLLNGRLWKGMSEKCRQGQLFIVQYERTGFEWHCFGPSVQEWDPQCQIMVLSMRLPPQPHSRPNFHPLYTSGAMYDAGVKQGGVSFVLDEAACEEASVDGDDVWKTVVEDGEDVICVSLVLSRLGG